MWRSASLCLGLVGLVAAADSSTAEADSGKKATSDGKSSDYSRFVPDYRQYIPNYTQYIPNYAKQYFNASWEQYVPKYEQYADVNKYIKFSKYMEHNHAPSSAEKCNTTAQLDAWRKKEEAPMRAFVPEAFRQFALDPIEEKYEENLKRIREAQKKQATATDSAEALKTSGTFLAVKFGDYDSNSAAHASSSSDTKSQSPSDNASPDYKQYIPDYKQYIPDYKQYIPANYTKSVPDYEKYIPDYEKYMDMQKYKDYAKASEKTHVESHPSRCKTVECLDAWRKHQEGATRTFVPKAYQSFQKDAVEEEYTKNLKRIKASEKASNETGVVAVSLAAADWDHYVPKYAKEQEASRWVTYGKSMQQQHEQAKLSCKKASECKTKEDLDAWKKTREAPIKKYVPKEYQSRALKSIEAAYKENLKRIKESQKDETPSDKPADNSTEKPADEATKKPADSTSDKVDDVVPSYAKSVDAEMFLSYASFIQQQHAPEKVSDCKTMSQLKAWYNKENAVIKEFVPQAYQTFPAHALEKKYEEHKRRMEASQESQQKTEPATLQLALLHTPIYIRSPLVALAAIMFSVAAVVSFSRRFRRESSLEEALLEPEAPCAA